MFIVFFLFLMIGGVLFNFVLVKKILYYLFGFIIRKKFNNIIEKVKLIINKK